jgi:hypothetical protein
MKLIMFTSGPQARPGLAFDGRLGLDLLAADPTLPETPGTRSSARLDRVAPAARPTSRRAPPRMAAGSASRRLPFVALTRVAAPAAGAACRRRSSRVGLNYRDHAAEQNKPLPEAAAALRQGAVSSLQAHDGPIASDRRPHPGRRRGRAGDRHRAGPRHRRVRRQEAADYIAGYTCFNDVTNREAQAQGQAVLPRQEHRHGRTVRTVARHARTSCRPRPAACASRCLLERRPHAGQQHRPAHRLVRTRIVELRQPPHDPLSGRPHRHRHARRRGRLPPPAGLPQARRRRRRSRSPKIGKLVNPVVRW